MKRMLVLGIVAMLFVSTASGQDSKKSATADSSATESDNKPSQPQSNSSPSSDTTKRLKEKVERVKAGFQKWAAGGRDPSEIAKAMVEKFKPLMEAGKIVEAEAVLDRVLEQLAQDEKGTATPTAPLAISHDASSYEERLPPKIHRIQKELPAWSEKPGNQEKAAVFMQKLKEQLDAMNFVEAEKTADAILETMGLSVPATALGGDSKPQQAPPTGSQSNDTKKRLTEKVERVTAGAQKWAASGRDPSEIAKAMVEKFKPLMEAGKIVEAEAELDRVLEQLGERTSALAPPTATSQDASSYEDRLPLKIQKIQKQLPNWLEKAEAENKQKAITLMQRLKEQMEAKNYEEVEKAADAILMLIGPNTPATAGTSAPTSGSVVSEEARREMRHNIDSSFVVFRDKVQEELKLTSEQKEKLEVVLPDVAQFLQKLHGLKPEDRKNEIKAYRPKAREKLAAVVKETLDEGQHTRLRQLVLQREGLRNGEIWKDLQVTDEQRTQFMARMQQAHRETQTLMEELKSGGARKEEIQPKVIKVRDDLEDHLNALLTDAQKKQWQEMLGKPMDLADLFDL